MALALTKIPLGFVPVGGNREALFEAVESSIAGKPDYRVELEFHGLFNGLKFIYRPDSMLKISANVAPMLRDALKLSENVADRLKWTFIKYQAVWTGGSDAQVSMSFSNIYFFIANLSILNDRDKYHVDNSLPSENKFLCPTDKLNVWNGRAHRIEWLDKVTDTFTFTTTGQVVANDPGTLTKTSGVVAWDSQGFSNEGYVNSCYLSFVPNSGRFMIGLNNDAGFNADYQSIDYAWDYDSVKNVANIFESGVYTEVSVGDIIPGSTKLSIFYTGSTVLYYKDGILIRSQARVVGLALYLDSSFYLPGSQITQIEFGPSVRWVTSANIIKDNQRQFRKTGGVLNWADQVYSTESYATNVYCKFSFSNNGSLIDSFMAGLNADPTTDANFTGIDYAWYIKAGPTAQIIENGIAAINTGACLPSDIFSIVYDGANVKYYKNGVQIRSVARAVGASLFFDSSFYNNNGLTVLTNVEFAPLPTGNFLNYNNGGGDITLLDAAFYGERNTLRSTSYSSFDESGTLTVKSWTGTVRATLLTKIQSNQDNAVFIEWVNSLGGLSNWLFAYDQVFDLSLYDRSKFKCLTVFAEGITIDEWSALQEFVTSGAEYNDDFKIGVYLVDKTKPEKPKNIVALESATSTRLARIQHGMYIKLRYPKISNAQ